MKEITLDQVTAAAVELVEKVGPKFVYQPLNGRPGGFRVCVYVDPGTNCPSCGVGRILHSLGVSLDTLSDMDAGGHDTSFNSLSTTEILESAGVEISDRAWRFLASFQADQDTSVPYGECLSRANRTR